jgi:hypothetical protein
MESEKAMYWMTLGVLAMAVTTGFVTEHRGWADHLADHSVAVMSQASEKAMNYAEIVDMVLGSERDSARPPRAVVDMQDQVQSEVNNRLACVQRVLARRQAEMDRLQAMRVQVRMLKRSPRTMVWPTRNLVIEIPKAF